MVVSTGKSSSYNLAPPLVNSTTFTEKKSYTPMTTKYNSSVNCDMEDFSGCEESTFGVSEGDKVSDNVKEECNSSSWAYLFTFYLPLAALWLKRSVFGVTFLVRTVILGHLLHLIFGHASEWMTTISVPASLHPILNPMGPHAKFDPKAWPPPTLIALGLLTLFTLVVHPDGLTWIVLGKFKNAVISALKSVAECWQLLVTDYGVLPSAIALITIAGLFFVMFAMLRSTINPRRSRRKSPIPTEKKKKKRKGTARHRAAKTKSSPTTPSRPSYSDIPEKNASTEMAALPTPAVENTPDLVPLTPMSTAADRTNMELKLSEHTQEAVKEMGSSHHAIPSLPSAASTACSDKEIVPRTRIASVSTMDTTAMSDDLSCASKLSLPPSFVSHAAATKSNEKKPTMAQTPTRQSASKKPRGDSKTRPAHANSTHNKRAGSGTPKSKATASKRAESGPSRWDALKPVTTPNVNPTVEGSNQASKAAEKCERNPNPRCGNRRGGRGGFSRKGRNVSPRASSRSPLPVAPPHVMNQSANATTMLQSPVSPQALQHDHDTGFAFSGPASLPPPPSGLGPIVGPSADCESRLFPAPRTGTSFLMPQYQEPNCLSSWGAPSVQQPIGQSLRPVSLLVPAQDLCQEWTPPSAVTSPARLVPSFSIDTSSPSPSSLVFRGGAVKENPFALEHRESEEQIEADLQELGGQMAGSILDF